MGARDRLFESDLPDMGYKDPDKQREYQRRWVADRRARWLADKSCVDCGSIDDLEVDHVDPAEKITHNVWSWAEARRDAELAKCVVRCWSCHVRKTVANGEKPTGSRHGQALLTDGDVEQIRSLYPSMNVRALGERFGVGKSTIHDIVSGKTWATA